MKFSKIVHIVINFDTEGPIKNSKKDILKSWQGVFKLTDKLFNDKFRNKYLDSFNKPVILNWFYLSLIGFLDNPHKRPLGFHKVFDKYKNRYSKKIKKYNDGCYWHYHQPHKTRIANQWSDDWLHTNEYDKYLIHSVAYRNYFPSCFRAGGRIENNDTSHWLEQFIPFDYSCCSGKKVNWDNIESSGKKLKFYCDWSKSSTDWTPYHPSKKDYQKIGSMKRWVIRCVDLKSNVYKLDHDDIRSAFIQASNNKPTILSFFEHDRRMITYDNIVEVLKLIKKVSMDFPEVKFSYDNAKNAVIKAMKIKNQKSPEFKIIKENKNIKIKTKDNYFGTKPFVIIKKYQKWHLANLKKINKKEWITNYSDDIKEVKVTAFSESGNYKISSCKL